MTTIGVFALLLLGTAADAHAVSVRIRVLDGRTGRPVAGEHLQIWMNEARGAARDVVTGKDGIALLEAPSGATIIVATDLYFDCRPFKKGDARPSYSVGEIVSAGVTAANTCGNADPEARVGELLLFVRPIHWWEGFRK
jgi:hypothetical protein